MKRTAERRQSFPVRVEIPRGAKNPLNEGDSQSASERRLDAPDIALLRSDAMGVWRGGRNRALPRPGEGLGEALRARVR